MPSHGGMPNSPPQRQQDCKLVESSRNAMQSAHLQLFMRLLHGFAARFALPNVVVSSERLELCPVEEEKAASCMPADATHTCRGFTIAVYATNVCAAAHEGSERSAQASRRHMRASCARSALVDCAGAAQSPVTRRTWRLARCDISLEVHL